MLFTAVAELLGSCPTAILMLFVRSETRAGSLWVLLKVAHGLKLVVNSRWKNVSKGLMNAMRVPARCSCASYRLTWATRPPAHPGHRRPPHERGGTGGISLL